MLLAGFFSTHNLSNLGVFFIPLLAAIICRRGLGVAVVHWLARFQSAQWAYLRNHAWGGGGERNILKCTLAASLLWVPDTFSQVKATA